MRKRIKMSIAAFVTAGALTVGMAGTAHALKNYPEGWSGACYGDDWHMWDGNGNRVIVHGKCA